jgi:hypothetical protein
LFTALRPNIALDTRLRIERCPHSPEDALSQDYNYGVKSLEVATACDGGLKLALKVQLKYQTACGTCRKYCSEKPVVSHTPHAIFQISGMFARPAIFLDAFYEI